MKSRLAEKHEEELEAGEYKDNDFRDAAYGRQLGVYVHELRVPRANVIARCVDWVSGKDEAKARAILRADRCRKMVVITVCAPRAQAHEIFYNIGME